MQQRRGFTLMELMVVIGIIIILAAISLPIITMVRKQAKDALCRNNLQQIGIGITGFQQLNDNRFPTTLATLFEEDKPLAGESSKMLLCPFDAKRGTDIYLGAPPSPPSQWADLSELHKDVKMYPGSPREIKLDISYVFEASAIPMVYPVAQGWKFEQINPIKYWNADNRTTWADAKVFALKHDNLGGTPFRLSDFPIARCFWHAKWPNDSSLAKEKRVLNLAWDMSLFWSIPEWEKQMRGN